MVYPQAIDFIYNIFILLKFIWSVVMLLNTKFTYLHNISFRINLLIYQNHKKIYPFCVLSTVYSKKFQNILVIKFSKEFYFL